MTTRREFLLGAGALAMAPSLPTITPPAAVDWRYLTQTVEIDPFCIGTLDAPQLSTVGGISRAMNKWWLGLPAADEAIPVGDYMKTLFDQCGRGET